MDADIQDYRDMLESLVDEKGKNAALYHTNGLIVSAMKMRYALAMVLAEKQDILTGLESRISVLKANIDLIEFLLKCDDKAQRRAHLRLEAASSDE